MPRNSKPRNDKAGVSPGARKADASHRTRKAEVSPHPRKAGPSRQAEKVDLLKLHREEYATPARPTLVVTTKANYLAIPGAGAPGSRSWSR